MLVVPWQESVNPVGEQVAPCVPNRPALRVFRFLLNRESKRMIKMQTMNEMKRFWIIPCDRAALYTFRWCPGECYRSPASCFRKVAIEMLTKLVT